MLKHRLSLVALVLIFIFSTMFALFNFEIAFTNPFDTKFTVENATRITFDNGGNRYIILDSYKKIARINAIGKVDFILHGATGKSDSFDKAWDITCDDAGNLYVLDFTTDDSGLKIDSESIKMFSSEGKFQKTVYYHNYSDNKPDMEGNFRRIKFHKGRILYYYNDQSVFQIGSIEIATGINSIIQTIPMENPKLNIVDCDFTPDMNVIAYITKKGGIFLSRNDSPFRQIYSSSFPFDKTQISIPWLVSVEKDTLYFSDVGINKIVKVDISSGLPGRYLLSGDSGDIIRSFQIKGDRFIAVTDASIIFGDFAGNTSIESEGRNYSLPIQLWRWFINLCLMLSFISLILIFTWIYIIVLNKTLPDVFMQSAMIVTIVVVTTVIVLQISVKTLTGIYRDNTFNNLKYISQLSQKYIDGDLAGKIRNREDFMNSDYIKLRSQLHSIFNENSDEWNSDYYGGLYFVRDNSIYVLMFFDDSSGVNFPYKIDYRNSSFANVIDKGEIITVEESDVYGSWIYALSPVYDSNGKIRAVLEIGKDLNNFQSQVKDFIAGITKEIITVLIILVLFMIEVTILRDVLHNRDKRGYGEGLGEFGKYSVHTVRMLAFIIAFSYALPISYTPLMMKEILERTGTTIFGLSQGMAMAVPISAEMLATAIFAVIAGYLVEKQGWKKPFIYGALLMSAGAFIAYYMYNPYLFIVARFLVGAAYGFALVTLQCYPMISSNVETRNSGLASQNSGLNAGYCCGVAIGGLCADYLGYSTVYAFSIFVALITMPYAKYLMSSSYTSDTGTTRNVKIADVINFFTNRNVFFFFVAAFIPVSICSMFLTYMFPVFAEEKGISAGDIGRVFMLNSLVIIYMGPVIVNFLTKRESLRGKNAMLLYMLVTLAGLLVFGLKPSVITAIIIIIFVGLGDSFGLPMSNDYLISLKAAAKIGYDKSIGYLNFIGNIGQMIGPLIMAYLFTFGYEKGTYIILLGMTASMLVFFLFSKGEGKQYE